MKYTILLLVCFAAQPILSQDTAAYEAVMKSFQENFNQQNIDPIFDLYNAETQEEMTKEGVTQFIKGCHGNFGNLKNLTFVQSAEGVNSYNAEFDNITLLIEVMLDADGKISSLQFQEP